MLILTVDVQEVGTIRTIAHFACFLLQSYSQSTMFTVTKGLKFIQLHDVIMIGAVRTVALYSVQFQL